MRAALTAALVKSGLHCREFPFCATSCRSCSPLQQLDYDARSILHYALCLHLLDCLEVRQSEHPVTAVAVEVVAVALTAAAAEVAAVELQLLATALPAVIFYAEVIPESSRSTQPCIPLTGSTTWTTFIINFRPPLTVPTLRYTVIIRK